MIDTIERLIVRCDWPKCDAEAGEEFKYEPGDNEENLIEEVEEDGWESMWNGEGIEHLCPRHKDQRATELRLPFKQTGPTLFSETV